MNAVKSLFTALVTPSALAILSTLISFTLFASHATGSTLINYKTNIMPWYKETSVEYGEQGPTGLPTDSDFFDRSAVQLDLSFVTPDFELPTGEGQRVTIKDPLITIHPTTNISPFLDSSAIAPGSFISFYLSPELEQLFSISINFINLPGPTVGSTISGKFVSNGSLTPFYGNTWNFDEFTFQQNNWRYRRADSGDQFWIFDTTASFASDNTNQMTIDKIPLSEPFAPGLLVIGLVSIYVGRKFSGFR